MYCCGSTLCTYCLLYRNIRGRNTNCSARDIFYVHIVYCTGTFVVVILIVLLWIYSMYRMWIVWAYTLNFDQVHFYLEPRNRSTLKLYKVIHQLWVFTLDIYIWRFKAFVAMYLVLYFNLFQRYSNSVLYFILFFSRGVQIAYYFIITFSSFLIRCCPIFYSKLIVT